MDGITLTARGAMLQDITLTLVVVLMITEILWVINSPKRHLYAVPLLILMIHTLVYYIYLTLFKLNIMAVANAAYMFTDWSALLRFHSVLTWLSLEGFRLYSALVRKRDGGHH